MDATDRDTQTRTPRGLYVARSVGILRHRPVVKTVTLSNGERAKVTVDDSGTVRHIEHGESIDAVVRPKTIRLHLKGGVHGAR